jgi:hypothetical protein
MNLVGRVVAVEDARQRAAMLSARYALRDMGGTCSLLWMTISWKNQMAEDLVATRVQWLLAQGACVQQGYVYASAAIVCRPGCAASREGACSWLLQKAGFCPLFACLLRRARWAFHTLPPMSPRGRGGISAAIGVGGAPSLVCGVVDELELRNQ